jgi:hypothetical protein
MYFHRRTERAARCLGEIVLVLGPYYGLGDLGACQLTPRSPFVYFGAADGIDAVQPQVVFVVH